MNTQFGKRPLRHQSFILSLWQEAEATADNSAVWRFSLENPQTSERRGFTEIAGLLNFLNEWTAVSPKELPTDQ